MNALRALVWLKPAPFVITCHETEKKEPQVSIPSWAHIDDMFLPLETL